MVTSLVLISALSLLIWLKWDWFTGNVTDSEIEQFFDEESGRGAGW